MNAITPKEWGEYGEAMKALPNDRWRAFVDCYLLEKPGRGAQTNAARRAGFGAARTSAGNMARIALRLMRDVRVVAAIAEESRKMLRAGAPEAVKALQNIIRDPNHKDHGRAIGIVLDRVDPTTTHQTIDVTHRNIDPQLEAIEELRALRQLGTSREKMLELFGGNGLHRLEQLEAADTAQRARDAKVIDGDAVEIITEEHNG